MSKVIYVGGDMLLKGSQILREQEKESIRKLGLTAYAPQDDKEINDKSKHTAESNDKLSRKIFLNDTHAMVKSDALVFEVSNNNVGTTTEIGQWAMVFFLYHEDPIRYASLKELATKPVFFHTTDIRDTSIPEVGYGRSHSYNQYLIGAIEEIRGVGIQTWEEIEEELKSLV